MEKNENTVLDYMVSNDQRLRNIENLLTISKAILNLDEVCIFTGLSKSHIYKLTCWGKIPYYKQSKHLYFDRLEIEAWLKANRFKTSEELEKEASQYVTFNKEGGKK